MKSMIPWKSRETGLDLFTDLEDIQREMNRLFDFSIHRPLKIGNGGSVWAPTVDIIDEKDQLCVRAELPGLKKEDIDVNLVENTLTIKGEKKQEKEVKEKDVIRSESFYGAFQRSFSLPAGIDPKQVDASYKDGILEIKLGKKEEAKGQQFKVQVK